MSCRHLCISVFQQGRPPDAVYAFKHALVQDAAYDSLLRRRRQQLHGKIATVIEEHWPDTAATEPELLAHHYTEAKLTEKAIPLWQKAASLALGHMALAEAIAHLNKGLELVAALRPRRSATAASSICGRCWALPGSRSKAGRRRRSGTACIRRWGWRTRCAATMPWCLFGLWANVLCTGRVAELRHWVVRISGAAAAYRDPDLLMLEHYCAVNSYFFLGEPIKARQHADQILSLYSQEQHGHLVRVMNEDLKTVGLVWGAEAAWMLRYAKQAVKMSDAAYDHAHQVGHPFDLGWALTTGVGLFDHLREPDEMLRRTAEADRVGRENSLPHVTECMVPSLSGIALIRKGQTADGIALPERGFAVWEAGGGRI